MDMKIPTSDKFTKYQHLEALTQPEMQNILLQSEVVCTEKIHGTNARVGLVEGQFHIGGRNIDHTNDGDSSVMGFVGEMRGYEAKFREAFPDQNIIFFGEWFGPGIQKGISYGATKAFRVFDAKLDGRYMDWDTVVTLATKIGFATVPVLYRGVPKMSVFESLLDIKSKVGLESGIDKEDNLHEGIVIKPTQMIINEYTGQWLIAKYKPARWSERKSDKLKEAKPIPIESHTFIEEFVTEIRLEHVLDHLRDAGVAIDDIKSTSNVIKEMSIDIHREGQVEREKLEAQGIEWKTISKLISSRTSTMFRDYLHKKLLERHST
jgi:hypothetical protein